MWAAADVPKDRPDASSWWRGKLFDSARAGGQLVGLVTHGGGVGLLVTGVHRPRMERDSFITVRNWAEAEEQRQFFLSSPRAIRAQYDGNGYTVQLKDGVVTIRVEET